MPTEQEDQDNYSVDEIMDRLRSRDKPAEQELVTRPDGTQVVKVRKRKRRSKQPHKEVQCRRQRVPIVQIALLVCLLLLVAGGVLGLFAYYNSRGFVDDMRGKIGTWTGADVEFTQFRVTPVSAGARTMQCRWPAGNSLRELNLDLLSADLRMTSFVSGRWSGEEVLAKKGKLRLGSIDKFAAARATDPPDAHASFPFGFIRYRCEKLALLCGEGARPPLRMNDVETSYYILPTGGQLRLLGGTVTAKGWPDLSLERGLIECRAGEVEMSSLRLEGGSGNGAFADIEGVIDLASTDPVFLDVRLQNFPLKLIAGEAFGRLLSVDIDSDATLSFVPGNFESHELVAPFSASPGTDGGFLTSLPFLELLRNEFPEENIASRDRSYSTESVGLLRRAGGVISVEQLRLEQKNQMAVRGEIRVAGDGKLSGELDVGVAERLALSHISPSFRKVFARFGDGYWWATVRLSGTLQRPQDNFAEMVKAVVAGGGLTAPDDAAGGEKEDLEKEFRDLIDGGGTGR